MVAGRARVGEVVVEGWVTAAVATTRLPRAIHHHSPLATGHPSTTHVAPTTRHATRHTHAQLAVDHGAGARHAGRVPACVSAQCTRAPNSRTQEAGCEKERREEEGQRGGYRAPYGSSGGVRQQEGVPVGYVVAGQCVGGACRALGRHLDTSQLVGVYWYWYPPPQPLGMVVACAGPRGAIRERERGQTVAPGRDARGVSGGRTRGQGRGVR